MLFRSPSWYIYTEAQAQCQHGDVPPPVNLTGHRAEHGGRWMAKEREDNGEGDVSSVSGGFISQAVFRELYKQVT